MKKNKSSVIIKFLISILDIIPVGTYTIGFYIVNIWDIFDTDNLGNVLKFGLLNTIVAFMIFILMFVSIIICFINLIVKYNRTLNISSNIILLVINSFGFLFGAQSLTGGTLEALLLISSIIVFLIYLIFDLIKISKK